MLTLQNFPTEYKLHDYQMYVRRLADSDSSYAEYSDFVKESTDFLAPLASKEAWEAFRSDRPIEMEACQSTFDVLNELERRYRTIETATGKGGERIEPAGGEGRESLPTKTRTAKVPSPRAGGSAVAQRRGAAPESDFEGDMPAEVRFMQRYIALDGKVLNLSRANVLLASLQKAITGKRIRKTSSYAKEVESIQKNLIRLVDNFNDGDSISIDKDTISRYSAIVAKHSPTRAVRLLKAYASLIGKTKEKYPNILARAKRLYARFSRCNLEGKYAQELNAALSSIAAFIEGSVAYVHPTDMALRGLLGLGGLGGVDGPISSTALATCNFRTIQLSPQLRKLLGEPEDPFKILIHGLPGSGKTTLAMRIAHSLAEYNQLRVLFVSAEEGVSYKAKKRIDQLELYSPNMYISAELPANLQPYDVVAIDSITTLGISPEELRDLYRSNPSVSFILVSQSTKSGTARGSLEYEHDADITIRCDVMVAHVVKNRFGECTSEAIR